MRCRFPKRESHADFPEVSLQLLDPSKWKLAAYGGFFRDVNNIVLEVRSIMYAVRYAEGRYPSGRLLILSDSLALVLALCKRPSKKTCCFQSCVGSFASGFKTGLVLSFRSIPSELNYSDEGSRFFDCDNDSVKSLLHALAQRSARSSPSRKNHDYPSHSRLHFDAGAVDHTPHTHVPAVGIRSLCSQMISLVARNTQRLSDSRVLP